jgi:hypothetical protein
MRLCSRTWRHWKFLEFRRVKGRGKFTQCLFERTMHSSTIKDLDVYTQQVRPDLRDPGLNNGARQCHLLMFVHMDSAMRHACHRMFGDHACMEDISARSSLRLFFLPSCIVATHRLRSQPHTHYLCHLVSQPLASSRVSPASLNSILDYITI